MTERGDEFDRNEVYVEAAAAAADYARAHGRFWTAVKAIEAVNRAKCQDYPELIDHLPDDRR